MKKNDKFKKTLAQLKSYLAMPIQNDRDKAGIIQAFEFTFEQCWKTLQHKASEHGVEVGSPKAAFIFAIKIALIDNKDEPKWIELIHCRNLSSHTYEEILAAEILEKIKTKFVPMFEDLLTRIDNN